MNRNGQSRRRQNVSLQTIIVGHSPIRRRQLAAEGAALFRPTLAAHGEHEKRIGQRDSNRADWYAAYMVAEQSGEELPQ